MGIFNKFFFLLLFISSSSSAAVFECMDLANSLVIKKYIQAIRANAEKCFQDHFEKTKKPISSECDSRAICTNELLQKHQSYLKDKVKICEGIKKKYEKTDLLTLPPEALIFEGKKPQSVDDVFSLSTTDEIERQELIYLKSLLPRYMTDEIDISRFCANYITFSPLYNKKKKAIIDAQSKGAKK